MWTNILSAITAILDFFKTLFGSSDKSDSPRINSNYKNSFNNVNSNNMTTNIYLSKEQNDSKHKKQE